jgi:hypothetical protein
MKENLDGMEGRIERHRKAALSHLQWFVDNDGRRRFKIQSNYNGKRKDLVVGLGRMQAAQVLIAHNVCVEAAFNKALASYDAAMREGKP